MVNKKIISIVLLLLMGFTFQMKAQKISSEVTGTVKDVYGQPLQGVIISSGDGEKIHVTNADGVYSFKVDNNIHSLIFSLLGYKSGKKDIESNLDVVLQKDSHVMDETIFKGFSRQSRTTVSGSIASVKGDVLAKSPVATLAQTLGGRLSGLLTEETSSELGRTNTSLHLRGISSIRANSPLVVIDGVVCPYNSDESLSYISPAEIESISVLKDAASQALYGIQGANGVIIVTTKRGIAGQMKVNVRLDESLQEVTTKPVFINSSEYATLRNEAAYNDGMGQNYFYSDDQIEKFRSGSDPEHYPNTNWYDMNFKKLAQMQRVGLDITGGNDKIAYYSNVNVMHQGGFYNVDQKEYNPNNNYFWANARSNVDVKLNQYLSAYLNLAGNIKREHYSAAGFVNNIYPHLFTLPSTLYGPVTPSSETDEGGNVITTENEGSPVYGLINRCGYQNSMVTNVYSQFGLKLDMSFLTHGLSMTGIVGFQTNIVNTMATNQNYQRYMRTSNLDVLEFKKKGTDENTELAYSKGSSMYNYLTYKAQVDYVRSFGLHHVSAVGYALYQNLAKVDVTSPFCLPYDRISTGAEVMYDYDDRYVLSLDMGYSGSEQYARGHRYATTPAASAAWVLSNESFIKENASWLSLAKFRAAYGLTANDQSGLSRFAYNDKVSVNGGGNIGYLGYTTTETALGNPNIEAEISKKINLGIDLGFANQLTLSFDIFKEKMDNMIYSNTALVPSYQGADLNIYPKTNFAEFENKGFEVEANYEKTLNKDLSFNFGGFVSYNKNTVTNILETSLGDDYAYPIRTEGHSYGQTYGYLVDYSNGNGFYNFQSEIDQSGLDYSFGTPRMGDLKYQDLNKDGIIDEKDKAPIGNGTLPRFYYGISGGITFKAFELSFLFQGVGDWSSVYSGMGVYETDYDGVYGSLHKNAWTVNRWNNDEKISAPALSLTQSTSHQTSDYYLYDRSYLRLKNLELGYTLPSKIAKYIKASKLKVVLSGQNLLTWNNMKSDDFGPEGSYGTIPVYRVYNVGVRVQF